jgi:hypothetical protein
MVDTTAEGPGSGPTHLDPAIPSRTASGVTLPCNSLAHSHSRTSQVTINLYISLEHRDGVERPHVEYDVSVWQISAGEVQGLLIFVLLVLNHYLRRSAAIPDASRG